MGTTSDKLTYLNTTKGKIKDVINMTGANITSETTFRNYATKLYDGYISVLKNKNTLLDNMPKDTSTGAITDAADLPVYEDKMSKESTQDGTPSPENPVEVKTVKGYRNLFESGAYATLGSSSYFAAINDTIITSPYTTSSSYRGIGYVAKVKAGKTYTFSTDATNVNDYLIVGVYQNTSDITDGSKILERISQQGNYTFTPSYDGYAIVGKVATNSNTQISWTYAQLVEGTEELPYVPYGTNWVYKKIIGKNLVGNTNMWERGDITNGQNVNSNYYIRTTGYIKVKPSTNYYFSSLLTSDNENWNIYQYDENKNFIIRNLKPSSFETNASCFYIRIGARRAGGGSTNIITLEDVINYQFMLEESSVPTEYEEYKENIITLPLRDNEIAGTSDYKDDYIIDKNGKCWLNKKLGKQIYVGAENENWILENLPSGRNFYVTINNGYPSPNSKIFNNIGLYAKNLVNNYSTYISSYGNLNYKFSEMTSIENFKTFLNNINMIVYYRLATPELIDLNYTVDLTLFKGINNISNSEDMDMEIKYIKDTYE